MIQNTVMQSEWKRRSSYDSSKSTEIVLLTCSFYEWKHWKQSTIAIIKAFPTKVNSIIVDKTRIITILTGKDLSKTSHLPLLKFWGVSKECRRVQQKIYLSWNKSNQAGFFSPPSNQFLLFVFLDWVKVRKRELNRFC